MATGNSAPYRVPRGELAVPLTLYVTDAGGGIHEFTETPSALRIRVDSDGFLHVSSTVSEQIAPVQLFAGVARVV